MEMKYIPCLNTIFEVDRLKKEIGENEAILLGEYGSISPLAAFHHIKGHFAGKIFLELIAKNKNRDLIKSYIITASSAGFDGIIIASGKFDRKESMAKPVYDLDPSQILLMAHSLRKSNLLPGDFEIGVRSAAGNGAVRERARFFLEHGADFIALAGVNPIEEFRDRTVYIQAGGESS